MTGRLIRTSVLTVLVIPLLLAVAPAGPDFAHSQASARPELLEKIVFSSSRDTPGFNSRGQVKIFLMNPDGTNPEKLTSPADCLTFVRCGDAFAALSPDGKRIVFDSNRNKAATEPQNTSDLFLMKSDGTGQTFLTRGSSATWSPSGGKIAFHRSASGTGLPINRNP